MRDTLNQLDSRKSLKFKIIFIIINILTIVIILGIELSKGDILNISSALIVLSNNTNWLFLAFFIFIIKYLADSASYYILIKTATGQNRFDLSFKTCLIGRYGDGITPLGTGGQPFQIYYLNKYGLELSQAAGIPLARVVPKILGYNLTMLFFFIFFAQEGVALIKTAAYIGLMLNSILPFVILIFAFNRSLGNKLTILMLKIGRKIRLVKNYNKSKDYWLNKVDNMLISIREYNSKPHIYLSIFVFSVIDIICMASIPYFVYRAFGGAGESWIFMSTSTMYLMSAVFIAPTPGTSGASEASFYAMFERIIPNGMMFYALMTWRMITFYSFIFGGMALLIYESIKGKKRKLIQDVVLIDRRVK